MDEQAAIVEGVGKLSGGRMTAVCGAEANWNNGHLSQSVEEGFGETWVGARMHPFVVAGEDGRELLGVADRYEALAAEAGDGEERERLCHLGGLVEQQDWELAAVQ